MRTAISAAILVVLALVPGCATAPAAPVESMDFVWGCWVQKQAFDGRATVFLRLLPNADRSAYEGQLTAYADNEIQPGGRASFARDGSRATSTVPSAASNATDCACGSPTFPTSTTNRLSRG